MHYEPQPFRTTELSNPLFENGHLRFITVKTPNLRGRGDITVFVPPGEQLTSLPLVILLHGVYGSSWSWSQQGGAHVTAMKLIEQGKIRPMVIAMPSDGLWGDGSGYLPHSGFDFEKWIVEDVPKAMCELISVVDHHSKLFIGGLSMGGFGALRLGAKYHTIFSGISAHSSITDVSQMSSFVEEPLKAYENAGQVADSVWSTIKQHRENLPPLRFDCGIDDALLEHNRKLHRQLTEAQIDHQYQEFPGAHDWSYWQEHLRDTLLFFEEIYP